MAGIDVEGLLEPLAGDSPAGVNLEYDPLFAEMERATETRAEQQFGDTVVPGTGSDWKTVRTKAVELFGRTKDLRVAVQLTRSLLDEEGIEGFSHGLAIVRGLVDRYWDSLHPGLDEDGALMRANALLVLANRDATIGALRAAPMIESRTLGRISFRDVERALAGETADGLPTPATVDAAFQDVPVERLHALGTSLASARDHVQSILKVFREKDAEHAPNLDPLDGLLRSMQGTIADRSARRGSSAVPETADTAEPDSGGGSKSSGGIGAVRTRDDVVRVLDLCCAYYERNEPSSPVPILLRRAQRLVTKNFMEILRDLTPDGVSQAEMIRGPEGND